MNDEQDSFGMPAENPASPAPEIEELGREIASVRSLIAVVLAGLLVLSLAVNVFMWRQVRIVRAQMQDERNHIARFQQAEPAIHDFFRRLQAFAASNPDFQPILRKYSVVGKPPGTNAPPKQSVR